MTLLAANNMGLSKFGASNAYADSALKEAIDALADKLTAKETDAVEKRTLASGNYDEENTDGVAGPAVSNAVFWPLSSKEANAVNNDLRVVDPEHPGWASSYWCCAPQTKTIPLPLWLVEVKSATMVDTLLPRSLAFVPLST